MLVRLLARSSLLAITVCAAAAAPLAGCADDDFGSERPAQDMTVPTLTDLSTLPDLSIRDAGDGGDASVADDLAEDD